MIRQAIFRIQDLVVEHFMRGDPNDPRELCPHFNVDGDKMCNMFPIPSDCDGYCRTLKVIRV